MTGASDPLSKEALPVYILHIPPRNRTPRRHAFRHLAATCLLFCGLLLLYREAVISSLTRRHEHHSRSTLVPSYTRNPAYLIRAKHGAVATENKLCSDIGVNTLKAGGNAVDAAVSSTLCIGVVNLFSSGIGGGGFLTVRIPSNATNGPSEVYTIDFRETAPAKANRTMYTKGPLLSRFGGLSVGIPGELKGLEAAHKRWGSLPWKDLVQPSIELAKGWHVTPELARRLRMYAALMLSSPDWAEIFAPKGRILQEGEFIQRKNLAWTLSVIAENGADGFYKGEVADAIVAKVQATGGILTHEDLEDYEVIVKPALMGTYRDKKIYTTHAPTSGPVLLHMFNLLEHFDDFVEEGRTGLNVHRIVETMKFGFAARTRVCDPAFAKADHTNIKEIPTKEYADLIFANLTDDHTHTPDYYHPIFDVPEDHGTSHVSIMDEGGMAIAVTSTVNLVFGSQVLDPVTGVLMNDEMDDFSTPGVTNGFGLRPSPYNYPEPGKRPLSSTAPTIVENADGKVEVVIGGSGGARIFPSVFQVLTNLDWGMDISAAVEFGRVQDQLYPLWVDIDDVYPEEFMDGLRSRGHNLTISDVNRIAGVVNAVVKKGDTIYAASDSRKNGIAAGY